MIQAHARYVLLSASRTYTIREIGAFRHDNAFSVHKELDQT
jgi:hypothetical protein